MLKIINIFLRGVIPRNPFPHKLIDIFLAIFRNKPREIVLNEIIKTVGLTEGFFVKSARHGLYLIFTNMLKRGDEIILTSFTCNALVGPIKKAGLVPVFADVSLETLNSEIEHFRPLITKKTKAILITHQFGFTLCDGSKIRELCDEYGILLIEDAASAYGATCNWNKVGLLGHLTVFSFEKSKVISCVEGGLVTGEPLLVNKILHQLKRDKLRSSFLYFVKTLALAFAYNKHVYPFTMIVWKFYKGGVSTAQLWESDLNEFEQSFDGLSRFQIQLLDSSHKQLRTILTLRAEMAKKLYELIIRKKKSWRLVQCKLSQCRLKANGCMFTYSRFPFLIERSVEDKMSKYLELYGSGLDLGFTFSYSISSYFNQKTPSNTFIIMKSILNIPISNSRGLNESIFDRLEKYLDGEVNNDLPKI
jgi:hypothetical protein